MNADQIIKLLALRHFDDVFVDECKDGPSQGSSHSRLDAWAMPRSWAKASVKGYEVKVSRADFARDEKWRLYLPLCNQLYFVCPTGLIEPSQMPGSVGLLWASKTGTRLYEKKKAEYRDVAISENLFRYILMCRTVVVRDTYGARVGADRSAYWREWLQKKEEDRDLGQAVGGAMHKRLIKQASEANDRADRAERLMKKYDSLRATIVGLGLDPDHFNGWNMSNRIAEVTALVPPGLARKLHQTRDIISSLANELDQLIQGGGAK